jgi:large subunit ribosomal protein L10
MLRTQKADQVSDLRDRFARMSSAVFVDYKGMNVEEVSKLRDVFRAKGVEYRVVKNTLVRQAVADTAWGSALDSVLRGMTGVAWSYEDPSAAAKVVRDFARENEKLKIKAGLIDGQLLDARGVQDQLANMLSKDEARAQFLAVLTAPAQKLLSLLQTPAQNVLGVLEAKRREMEGEQS